MTKSSVSFVTHSERRAFCSAREVKLMKHNLLGEVCLLFRFCVHFIPFFFLIDDSILFCFDFVLCCWGSTEVRLQKGRSPSLDFAPSPCLNIITLRTHPVKSNFPSSRPPGCMGRTSVMTLHGGTGKYALWRQSAPWSSGACPSNGITDGDCGTIFLAGGNGSPHIWDWLCSRCCGTVLMKFNCL